MRQEWHTWRSTVSVVEDGSSRRSRSAASGWSDPGSSRRRTSFAIFPFRRHCQRDLRVELVNQDRQHLRESGCARLEDRPGQGKPCWRGADFTMRMKRFASGFPTARATRYCFFRSVSRGAHHELVRAKHDGRAQHRHIRLGKGVWRQVEHLYFLDDASRRKLHEPEAPSDEAARLRGTPRRYSRNMGVNDLIKDSIALDTAASSRTSAANVKPATRDISMDAAVADSSLLGVCV